MRSPLQASFAMNEDAFTGLANELRWLIWRQERRGVKATKVPYAVGGKRANATDSATWCNRNDAEVYARRFLNGDAGGVGVVLGHLGNGRYLGGLDLDSCIGDDSKPTPWAANILSVANTYAEISPSGRGIKCFFYIESGTVRTFLDRIGVEPGNWGTRRGVVGANSADHGPAVEVYCNHRFFTVTSNHWPKTPDRIELIDDVALADLAAMIPPPRARASNGARAGGDTSRSAKAFREAIRLKRQGCTYDELRDALLNHANPEIAAWTRDKGLAGNERELKRLWAHADIRPDDLQRELPPPGLPMDVARVFVDQRCTQHNTSTLRYWCGSWWQWQTTHWAEVEERTVRHLLYHFTDKAIYRDPKKNCLVEWAPTRRRIADLLEALSAIVSLSVHLVQPCWLDRRRTGPIIAVRNGLLDINTRELRAHSPLYFCTASVPFDYDANAPAPCRWLNFLGELWPDEPEAIDALGEWFGYVISGCLDLQKILLMVGPTRGGTGLIARIEQALIGNSNSCGPTLSSLNGEFGLAPLIDRSLAVISDARFSGKNSGPVVERLLSISGEDTLTINRKYKEQWSGRLPTRLHVISNELPRLGDASTAIVGRFVVLILSRSWLGKENHQLEAQLREELPGILNWALEGLARLNRNDGHFTSVKSAEEPIITMRDLASPVTAFVRDRCTLRAGLQVGVDEIYGAFKCWCQDNEYPKSPKAVFGRNLMAAYPAIRKARIGPRTSRAPVYQGIGLAKDGNEPEGDLQL